MNEQIEEMEKVINCAVFADFRDGHGVCIKTISEHLYNADYRKASDVAKEIFDTLHKEIVDAMKNNIAVRIERVEKYGVNPYDDPICMACTAKNFALDGIDCFIASQRKKYESEGEE